MLTHPVLKLAFQLFNRLRKPVAHLQNKLFLPLRAIKMVAALNNVFQRMQMEEVLQAFGLDEDVEKAEVIHGGLINQTWKVVAGSGEYVLQTVNHNVFKDPPQLAENISRLAKYFKQHFPEYIFTAPVSTKDGSDLYYYNGQYYRVFPFIKGSHSVAVVENAEQAYEAAKQFGNFTSLLNDFPAEELHLTIPDFHNLTLRYQQFEMALHSGIPQRLKEAARIIVALKEHVHIANKFEEIKANPAFKQRVTHHDTKISNVLFDVAQKGICVIDLDTVMPGYFISDVGDMMRTYLSPASEEEKNYDKVVVRREIYDAVREGYMSNMDPVLSNSEKEHFAYSGRFLIYMQALRFITDFLQGDIYYGEKYPGHNLVRGSNQLRLLQEYEKEF